MEKYNEKSEKKNCDSPEMSTPPDEILVKNHVDVPPTRTLYR